MSERNDFILARAQATRSAQDSVAGKWVSQEKSVADWDADISAFQLQREATADAVAAKDVKVGQWDATLAILHEQTQTGLNLFKTKYRNDPSKGHMLKLLTAQGNSRSRIMEDAIALESAWEQIEPLWQPMPDQSLASFKALRLKCDALSKGYSDAKAAWRNAAGKWNTLADKLHEDCVVWYDNATHVFRAGTAEGDMIRATIPVTTNNFDIPEQVVISNLQLVAPRAVVLEYSAERATSFDVLAKGPADAAFAPIATGITEASFGKSDLAPGVHRFKVVGKNSMGAGPESEPASITIV